MADISKIKLPGENTARNIKDAAVRERVTALENAGSGGTTKQYSKTLSLSGWVGSAGTYTYTLSMTELKCGSDGSVSPIISWTSNFDDYCYIESATATAGTGIVFTTKVQPTNDIGILIIDLQ